MVKDEGRDQGDVGCRQGFAQGGVCRKLHGSDPDENHDGIMSSSTSVYNS